MALAPDVVMQIAGYQDATTAVRRAVLAYITRTWGALTSYRDADIDRWVAAILPVVAGGLAQTAALTDAYLATVVGLMTDSPANPIGVRPGDVSVEALRGVPAEEVYRRAGQTVWWELSKGAALAVAVDRGLTRAQRMAETDLQLAKTHTSRVVLSADDRVVGYERVADPGACELCSEAAGTVHGDDELMPIHAGCGCDAAPVIRSSELADDEENPDPDADAPPGGVPIAVHEHSEVGPVLTAKGHDWTSAADLDL